MTNLNEALREAATERHKAFSERLIPTVPSDTIIGVPMPALRKIAKDLDGSFLRELPHESYEENILHGLLINRGVCEDVMEALDDFLPYLDNWAVVDAIDPPEFYRGDYRDYYERLMKDSRPFVTRLGIVLALRHLAEDPPGLIGAVAAVESGPYYVDMAMAWFFAEALLHDAEAVFTLLESEALTPSVTRKTVRKIKESFRVPDELKNRAAAVGKK
ncbi:DNA alkylation repair protein [Aedoeadaptatus pacaensis]|uniref:DNA alkylation repair protein n=1 Tax=Aedoeadaptatus pacaensis TaxID=1776390 RepID=UPI000837CBE0|nr:DNA alkylation repair protein [Peptoniphilus pacaensis]